MAYDYEKDVISELEQMGVDYESNGYFNMSIEVEEVYRKAKAMDEILKMKLNMFAVKEIALKYANDEPFNSDMYIVHTLVDSLLDVVKELEDKND